MYTHVDIGPWTLTTYTLSHVTGVLVAGGLSYREIRRIGFTPFPALGSLLFLVLAVHVTAHAYHVAVHLARYLTDPRGLFNFWNQGLAIHGGLIGAGLAILLVAGLGRCSPWQLTDALAPAAALALFFFRLGCYGRGCCHGLPCGEDFLFAGLSTKLIRNAEISVHPTQLYSAVATLILFAILWVLRRRKLFEGELGIIFLLFYSTQRFLIEFLRASHLEGRTPIILLSKPLNTNQVFAASFFVCGLVLLAFRWKVLREGVPERLPRSKTGGRAS